MTFLLDKDHNSLPCLSSAEGFWPANYIYMCSKFDSLGRSYERIRFGVNPANGNVGNTLVERTWYDAAGNVIKSQPAGSEGWAKTVYDGLARPVITYTGMGTDANYAAVLSVSNDIILEQNENVYDAAGNILQIIQKQRYHNALDTDTGPLADSNNAPQARVNYTANYSDPLGRTTETANYGTNGGAAFVRPDTVPDRAEEVLITSRRYNQAGHVEFATDPAGMVTRVQYDAAGRRVTVIENYQQWEPSLSSGSSENFSESSTADCPSSDDINRTTLLTYAPHGEIATLTAVNLNTGLQVTTYVYGTSLADSGVATGHLLREVQYPDKASAQDVVRHTYNRLSEVTSLTDQNGSVHQFDYDLLGRRTQDRVVTLGTGVDGAVRRVETSYEVRGLIQRISSYDQAEVGSGNVVNEVRWAYNDFEQPITTWQAHSGAVDTMSTPNVQYEYADGSDNTIRPTALIYPNGREIACNYGSSGSTHDRLSRMAAIVDSAASQVLAAYQYVGHQQVVQVDSPQPQLRYSLVSPTETDDPDTGDIYAGLDRLGRVKEVRWSHSGTDAMHSQVQYGYDRASNRVWRANDSDPHQQHDWLYQYDGLHRLKSGQRGTLHPSRTDLTATQFAQCWSLDATGNWRQFRESDNGSTWTLEQHRTANGVNEVTSLTSTTGAAWATPVYDANGNMREIPRPAVPASSQSEWSSAEDSSFESPQFLATYDAWNRLVTLTDDSGTVQKNAYDGRNFRIAKQDFTAGVLNQTRHYYLNESWQILEERLDSNTSPDRHFLWGIRYLDDLICRDRSTTGTLNERLYALQDANWNLTTLVNSNGTVVERFEYDPYGQTTFLAANLTEQPESQFEWETTYASYRWDQEVSLFQVRYRWYSSMLWAWVTRDPIGYASGFNIFLYVYSSPSNLVDPYGLKGKSKLRICVDQPGKGGDRDISEDGKYGHVWIELFDPNGKFFDSAGFEAVDPQAAARGRIIQNGRLTREHDPSNNRNPRRFPRDVYLDIPLTDDQYEDILNKVKEDNLNPPEYNLNDYNCVNWALDIVDMADKSLKDSLPTERNYEVDLGPFKLNFQGLAPGPFGEDLISNPNIDARRGAGRR